MNCKEFEVVSFGELLYRGDDFATAVAAVDKFGGVVREVVTTTRVVYPPGKAEVGGCDKKKR